MNDSKKEKTMYFLSLEDKVKKQGETLKGALNKFQDLNIKAQKSSTNPHFKSKYSDLTSVINAVNHGAEFGLSFTLSIEYKNIILDRVQIKEDATQVKYQEVHRDIFVTTTVKHIVDSETLTCSVPVLINANDKDNPQKMGSAITYAKRYGLQSLYGLASDDDDGNSIEQTAIEYEEGMREKKKMAADSKALDQYVAEHPFSPQEATLQITANLFDVASLQAQYNKIKAHGLHSMGTHGQFYYSKDNQVKFRPIPDGKPVLRFPHRKGDDNSGCITIYESPYKNQKGQVPLNMYVLCHDPYGQNQSADSTSLGAAYVLKRPNNISRPDDMIVASYVGRPNTSDEYNRNLFMLADYYGCKIGFENDRGEIIAYAKRHRKLHRLQEEFEMLDKKDLRSKTVKRQYGMHMTEQRKRQGEIYIRDWLISPRGKDEEGEVLLNLHKLYDPALIQELTKFNHVGNFDRVMALMIGMFHTRELYNAEIKEVLEDRSSDGWFDKNYS